MPLRHASEIRPGDLYTTDGKDVWRVEWMCIEPTVRLVQLVQPGETATCVALHGGVGGRLFKDMQPLVRKPEGGDATDES